MQGKKKEVAFPWVKGPGIQFESGGGGPLLAFDSGAGGG